VAFIIVFVFIGIVMAIFVFEELFVEAAVTPVAPETVRVALSTAPVTGTVNETEFSEVLAVPNRC
jgi:hypothetical protein